MGQRITYSIAKDNFTLKDIVTKYYEEFREWFLRLHYNSIEEYKEPLGAQELINYLENHKNLVHGLINLEQNILDELVSEFIVSYCDYGGGTKLFKILYPCVNKLRYKESTLLIHRKLDEESIRIWDYLINGRSLYKDEAFTVSENKIAFWKPDEWKYLIKSIEREFGFDFKKMRNNQKGDFKSDINDRIFLLTNQNREFFGIGCIIQMLKNLPNREEIEIVISIN